MQGQPEVDTDELWRMPSSVEFWERYVSENKPVIFRGASTGSRAFTHWTEEYLTENFGDLAIRLEGRHESSDKMPVGKLGLAHDTLANFLDRYQSLDAYAITQLPEPMEKDVIIPSCLACGTFRSRIQEIHLFLSAKGGQTLLHRDPYSSLHCVFNGSKDWTLVHPRQLDKIYMSESSDLEWGGFSNVDVDNVDLNEHPLVKEIEISKVHMEKGDCIFMPGGYWHFVQVQGYMNSAVSIWFSRMQQYDDGPCIQDAVNKTNLTANEYDVIWRFPGHGDLTQGHMDVFILKEILAALADNSGVIPLTKFVEEFMVLSDESSAIVAMREDIETRREQFLARVNSTKDGTLKLKDLDSFSIDKLKELTDIVHPNDVSNTARFEYSHIKAGDVRDLLNFCIDKETAAIRINCVTENYIEELGGTSHIAEKIVLTLRLYHHHDLQTKIGKAVSPFANALFHDPETERRIYRFLTDRRLIPSHDEL